MNSDFDDESLRARLDDEARTRDTGRPVWFLLTDRYEDPGRWRRLMQAVHAARGRACRSPRRSPAGRSA